MGDKIEEKYFAFIENEGKIDLVYWCKTEAEARDQVKKWKKAFPQDKGHYYVGEVLA